MVFRVVGRWLLTSHDMPYFSSDSRADEHVATDQSGRSELPPKTARDLAFCVRTIDLQVDKFVGAIRAARGSIAPTHHSLLELQDAWGLMRAGLSKMHGIIRATHSSLEAVASQLQTGATASKWHPLTYKTRSGSGFSAR